jgi:separase
MEGGNGGLYRSGVNLLFLVCQPLQALEALLLLRIVSEKLEDHAKSASSSCHLTQQLLNLSCPSYAQVSAS